MALITSAASGNFNAGATWTGGVVPTTGDEARAATGHTVTINVNTTCDEVSNAGTGKFVFANDVTLTSNVTNKSATAGNCVELTGTNSASIVGVVTSGGTTTNTFAVANLGTGTLTITGNVIGSSQILTNRNCITNNSTGIINITGDVTGAGTGAASVIVNASTGVINLTGTTTSGTGTAAPLQNNSTGTFTVVGNLIASNATPAFASASSAATNVLRGNFQSSAQGVLPIYAQKVILGSAPSQNEFIFAVDGISTTATFYTADALPGVPSESDVRSGTVYGSSSELTGTLAVPPTGSVALGVPVDATTGTAALTPASVWDHLLTAITTSSTIGTLLKTNIDATISSRSTATTAGIADAVWDEATSDHTASGTYGGRVVRATNANNELQINAQNHAAANVHQFQTAVITASAFDASVLTAFAVPELQEIHAIHGLKSGSALTVTPSSRSAGAISQSITGDGTTTTTVTRT